MKNLNCLIAAAAIVIGACSPKGVEDTTPSTVVNADGTVTFNYRNNSAKSVHVDVQFAGRNEMKRDSLTGLWSVTLGPAAPDMYPYCFIVDGVSIMDPMCDEWFPNEGFKNSLLEIKGEGEPLVHTLQDVPHGNVDYVTYYSKSLGTYNHALVYTPASYNESNDNLPVFYLISGTTDTEEVYYKVGRANVILDNMIAKGESKEMIVVMPYGNPIKLLSGHVDFRTMGDVFSKDLINDLMPYIENNYRTINDRDHRGIGGFSRGGNQALLNGLTNIDKFSYLCSYSSFTTTEIPDVYDNAEETNKQLHLFWLGIGTDDFLYGTSRDYLEFLDKKGIRTVKEFTNDKFGHTWMNAKYFLSHTLKLLFNPEASEEAMSNGTPAPEATGEEVPFTPSVMARLFPRPIISPEYNGDGRVTFRVKAPEAKSVTLESEITETAIKMESDTTGVWSVTLNGVRSDIFCYNFNVDGLKVADASNMYLAPDKGFKRSIAEMPEHPYEIGNTGDIDYTPVTYITGKYDDGKPCKYAKCSPRTTASNVPTIALIAPKNETYESWHKVGQANYILDQLIAAGETCPCVVYMIPSDYKMKASETIKADDYATWSERREALVKVLKSMK